MQIVSISQQECSDLLARVPVGRLGCSMDNQPYVVPVGFSYEPDFIYVFSTVGKKIEWMRNNPKVCLQVDEIGGRSNWTSVVVTGTYLELRDPHHSAEREHARERLSESVQWWLTPLAQRREHVGDLEIEPLFFRIDIVSMSGLRAMPDAE